jgi:hypothetical protein
MDFARRAQKNAALAKEREINGLELPLWAETNRGAPAAVVRSALFGVIKRGARRAVEQELLVSWKGDEIRYTGFRLDQADLDVWLQVLHLARQLPLGSDICFNAHSFLRSIGRNPTGNAYNWLSKSIGRLQACGVMIRLAAGYSYQGPLIERIIQDENSGRYVVRINQDMAQLFDAAFVRLSTEKRKLLKSDLALWLQGYVQSHRATEKDPHRIMVERLRNLCGSSTKELWKYRQQLKKALEELTQVEILGSYSFAAIGGYVQWVRNLE